MASPGASKKLCGHPTPSGKYPTCHNVAGKETTHIGFGKCKKHGGTGITHIKHAELEAATAACLKLGVAVDTNPFDALMQVQAEANGYVEYFRRQVQQLDPDAVFVRPTSILRRPLNLGKDGEDPGVQVEEITGAPLSLNIAIKSHKQAMVELRDTAKVIAALGLTEEILKRQSSEYVAGMLRRVVEALGHSLQDSKVEALIRSAMKS